MTTTTEIRTQFAAYIVETDTRRHSGLHTCTSPHVLTTRPEAGDRIVAVLSGTRGLAVVNDGDGLYSTAFLQLYVPGRVMRHAGRSAMIGEDTLDGAFGDDALPELMAEILAPERMWRYAPVEWTPGSDDVDVTTYLWEHAGDGRYSLEVTRPVTADTDGLRLSARGAAKIMAPVTRAPRQPRRGQADEPVALLLIYLGNTIYAVYGTGRIVSLMTEPDPPVRSIVRADPFVRDGNRWVRRAPGQ